MNNVFSIAQAKLKTNSYPEFRVGDVVRVHRRVQEGAKERVQIIEGVIIAHKHGAQPGATITLRRVTLGVAVELVLPLFSPFTEKIMIVKRQKTRQAKLYYLRKSKGKKSKLRENIEGTKRVKEQEVKREAEKVEAEKAKKTKEDAKEEKAEELEKAPKSNNIIPEKEKAEEKK
jgi:large subunit ribosomal protein L19